MALQLEGVVSELTALRHIEQILISSVHKLKFLATEYAAELHSVSVSIETCYSWACELAGHVRYACDQDIFWSDEALRFVERVSSQIKGLVTQVSESLGVCMGRVDHELTEVECRKRLSDVSEVASRFHDEFLDLQQHARFVRMLVGDRRDSLFRSLELLHGATNESGV